MTNEKKSYSKPEVTAMGRLDRFINTMVPPPFILKDGTIGPYGTTPGGAPRYVLYSMSLP
ncbi:MAG: hypothetical protein U0670_22615 [Anaerolineae bacterium]